MFIHESVKAVGVFPSNTKRKGCIEHKKCNFHLFLFFLSFILFWSHALERDSVKDRQLVRQNLYFARFLFLLPYSLIGAAESISFHGIWEKRLTSLNYVWK